MDRFKTQVKKEHYSKRDYDNFESFISYYYQTRCLLDYSDEIENILEIGIGNKTLTNYLKEYGFNTTTCDYAADLKPDKVADIRKLPFSDEEFDAVVAFEVLEHIPFTDFDIALKELRRVSKKYVIISIPNSTSYIEWKIKFSLPKIRDKQSYFKFQIPNFLTRQGKSNHKWELNKKNFPSKKIRNVIMKSGLEILNEFEPKLNLGHHFFFMKKV